MTLPYGNSRSIELALAVQAPDRTVFRALCEPDEIVRWFGRKATGFVRAGGHLELLLGPADLGLERNEQHELRITFRDVIPPRLIVLDVTDKRSGRPQPLQIELREQPDRTIITLSQTGFDPSDATERVYRAMVRAWNFHLANLKSVLERGLDLRGTVLGEIFRFEGTALADGLHHIRAEAQLPGPRSAAFHAMTDATERSRWWPGRFSLEDSGSERFEADVSWGSAPPYRLRGNLAEYSVPEKLRFEFTEETDAGPVEATALIAFVEEGKSSRGVVVQRSGSPRSAWGASFAATMPGWDGILARLARHIALL